MEPKLRGRDVYRVSDPSHIKACIKAHNVRVVALRVPQQGELYILTGSNVNSPLGMLPPPPGEERLRLPKIDYFNCGNVPRFIVERIT